MRPRQEVLLDYKRILQKVYDPAAYAGRLERLSNLLDNSNRRRRTSASDSRHGVNRLDMLHRIVNNLPEPREIFRPAFGRCVSSNPQSARWIVALTALYLHLGPFSRYVVGQIEQKIDGLQVSAFDAHEENRYGPTDTAEFNVV
jgi:hypothetical protein